MTALTLLGDDGATRAVDLAEAPSFTRPAAPLRSRVAYAAAHVVPLAHGDNTPGRPAQIDWDATLLALKKIGYDGAWMFELAAAAERKPVLELAVKARERFEALLHIGDEMMGLDEP